MNTRGHSNPAPGIYKSSFVDKTAAPKFGFGTSTREKNYLGLNKINIRNSPGPGSYKIPVHIAKTPYYANMKNSEKYKYV